MLMIDLWEGQKGQYFCISTKSLTGRWKDHFIRRGRWADAKNLINENLDKDLYMCPHGFTTTKRLKECSVDPCLLYADLDECDPRTLSLKPTVAIESSPGRFVGYWYTDRPATEELNRRLAYMIGADISGWDRTQVLRIPNTRNYKYPSKPRVKILWTDGPTYEVDTLEKLIPEIRSVRGENLEEEAAKIYKLYETKLSRWARRELFNKNVIPGKRSEVLWKLHNALLEAGMTRDESFKVLWVSPWNKFKERRNGADQLWRELDKALDQHFQGFKADDTSEDRKWNPLPVPISEVQTENINWLIPGIIARKELTIFEGDPGLGKSYLVQMIAGLICDGKHIPPLPKYLAPKGRVCYFDTENTASTVTKARLEENGIENLQNYFQGEEPFSIDEEERWAIVVDRIEQLKPELVVFDTVNTYIGGTDTYRSSETQQAMSYFKEIAVRFNCGVVILRHLTKGGKDKALYRGQGSIAFTGAARIVATVGRSPDDDDVRVVACTKNNISAPFKSFTYTIEGLPDTLKRTNRSKLVWGEIVDYDSDDILAAPAKEKNQDKENAVKWLRETLENLGRVEFSKLLKMAEARSLTKSVLNRAGDTLGVVKDVDGFGKQRSSWWSLPSDE